MSDGPVWSEDVCTCGHKQGQHDDEGAGRCRACAMDASWAASARENQPSVCGRYQWDGRDRKRLW